MENYTNNDKTATSTSIQTPPPPLKRIHTLPVPVPPPKTNFEEEILSMDVGTEPVEVGARLKFQIPDGGRMVIKFHNKDDVKIIHAFLAKSYEEDKTGKSCVLRYGFTPKDLIDKIHETISSCSFSGEIFTFSLK